MKGDYNKTESAGLYSHRRIMLYFFIIKLKSNTFLFTYYMKHSREAQIERVM